MPRVDVAPPGADRDRIADDRDRAAETHDKASAARDQRADDRDERSLSREHSVHGVDLGTAGDREAAKHDREEASADRIEARRDRHAAAADRALASLERAEFLVDELTGAYRRAAGLMELNREAVKATRTGQSFVLAFIDLDDLKTRNDSYGHAAGDRLLRLVIETVRGHVRAYDPIVRYGGDEFLVGMLDVDRSEAVRRFAAVNAQLRITQRASISVGLAELDGDQPIEDLIAQADDAMYRARRDDTPTPS